MASNSFGTLFRMTSFGESHGVGLGAVIDGCPSMVPFDQDLLQKQMSRRRPGQSKVTTARDEKDQVEILSGVFEGQTLGTPIAMVVYNKDQRSKDYSEVKNQPRPGHADDVWKEKFGHSDYRGGGRSSGRETLARVMAGTVAEMFMKHSFPGVKVSCFSRQIGDVQLTDAELAAAGEKIFDVDWLDQSASRFPNQAKSKQIDEILVKAKTEGHSYGGVAEIQIQGVPKGIGQPVFHKLKSDLACAFLSVGATASFELGSGQESTQSEGSQFHACTQDVYGGIRGGISTVETIRCQVGFKPTATVLHAAKSGRHDPCIVPRAVVVLEAMAKLVIADHLLWSRLDRA